MMETRYTTEDLMQETLWPHPALAALVREIEEGGRVPTPTEALLINVIVRQQNVIVAVAREMAQHRADHAN